MIALGLCSLVYLVVQTVFTRAGIYAPFMTPLFALVLASSVFMRKWLSYGFTGLVVLVLCVQTYLACGTMSVVGCYLFSAGIWYFILPVVYRAFFRWEFLSDFHPVKFGVSLAKTTIGSTVGFYLVSNFICWLQMSSAGSFLPSWLVFQPYCYSANLSGLLTCYLVALPYYGYQLGGTFLFFGMYVFLDRYLVSARAQLLDRWYSLAHLPSPVRA